MNFLISRNCLLFVVLLLGIMSGCKSYPFSGSAAMRVEVEVYKGPLSEEPEVQWNGLLGFIDEVEQGLTGLDNFTRAIFANQFYSGDIVNGDSQKNVQCTAQNVEQKKISSHKCFSWPIPERELTRNENGLELQKDIAKVCQMYEPYWPWPGWGAEDHWDCFWLSRLLLGANNILDKVSVLRSILQHCEGFPHSGCTRSYLGRVARLATEMRGQAMRWAVGTTPGPSPDYKVRVAVVSIIVAMAEYGNQLKARADALLKQTDQDSEGRTGLDRRELPPSVYFRASDPTDFSHLYEWLGASAPHFVTKEWWRWPMTAFEEIFSYLSPESVTDRIKIVDRLFSDLHWAKINTVYASGRGTVNIALIKDDVGNWNLRSFDSDPGELLKAYNNFSINALNKASQIITDGATGGFSFAATRVSKILFDLANTTSFGSHQLKTKIALALERQYSDIREITIAKLKEETKNVENGVTKDSLTEVEKILKEHLEKLDTMARSFVTE